MTPEELRIVVKDAVREQMGSYCVNSEQHYRDHEFVGSFRETAERVQSAACKTMTSTLIIGVIGFFLWAFRRWLQDLFGASR